METGREMSGRVFEMWCPRSVTLTVQMGLKETYSLQQNGLRAGEKKKQPRIEPRWRGVHFEDVYCFVPHTHTMKKLFLLYHYPIMCFNQF